VSPPRPPAATLVGWRALLATNGGSHLRNVSRVPGDTCQVCTTFVRDGYDRCYRCRTDALEFGGDLADLVVPLTYGVNGVTSGRLMYAYKSGQPGESWLPVTLLLRCGYYQHRDCIGRVVGRAVGPTVTVPSLRSGREGPHPLRTLADGARLTSDALTLAPTPVGLTLGRATGRGAFEVNDPLQVVGEHVVVLDDTWTSGGNAQSAALALRQAGASHVTVLVIARWINPGNGGDQVTVLERKYLGGREAYDSLRCPVTGGACP
jgi:hypothetical protein